MSDFNAKKIRAKNARRQRSHLRIRRRVAGTAERPRLSVHKSLRFVYAQVIDDSRGVTLAQASSREAAVVRGVEGSTACRAAARAVGEAVAERAQEKGVQQVVFDRGGYVYHGRVKELAEGARAKGLKF